MPGLDRHALDKQIAARRLGPVHLFVGEDVKLVDRTVDAVEATIDPADRPFAVERLYACETGGYPVDIAAAARAYPMLGDRRIVIVLRAERLLKPKRARKPIDDEDVVDDTEQDAVDAGPLEDYLASPVPSTTLLFVATDVDRGRRFTKRLIEKAMVTLFEGLADGQYKVRDARGPAFKHIEGEMARAGRTIDPAGARLLVDRAGGEISRLRGDLERLLIYTEGRPRITETDVDDVASSDVTVEDEWAVTNALGNGRADLALFEVGRRLDRGDSVFALLGQLRWWVSNKLAGTDPQRVRPAIEALLRTDLALKSSGGDERVLMERLVVELAGNNSRRV